ncbi:hypothetical protein ACS0TY_004759 [Phlomoides rotata]
MAHLAGFANLAGFLADFLIKALHFITRNDPHIISSELQHDRPSPSLAQLPALPFHSIVESVKDELHVAKYDRNIMSESCDKDCVVCLSIMEEGEEVRQLPNCKHVLHKDCIDAWIDTCRTTCPICRSDLLPGQGEKFRCGDPWRRERMIYLFGEDSFL